VTPNHQLREPAGELGPGTGARVMCAGAPARGAAV